MKGKVSGLVSTCFFLLFLVEKWKVDFVEDNYAVMFKVKFLDDVIFVNDPLIWVEIWIL